MTAKRFNFVLLLALLFTIPAFGEGAALYKQKACAQCHGADGSGNTPTGKALKARDLRSDGVQQQTDDELAAVITDGRGKMPAYKSSLSAEELRELVTYIRSLAKKQ
ncbi:MAG TPA: cytochrome c [Thermoanaerobaculia bacterium]|jgi:mono/diheme cytochrome c family protein